jgi:hypothetical protein
VIDSLRLISARRLRYGIAVMIVLATLLCAPAGSVRAAAPLRDGPISITTAPAVRDAFPDELTFTVAAHDSAPITDAVLSYTLLPEHATVRARAEFDKGTDIAATYHMRSSGNPLYLPPGKQIQYVWELSDANGATFSTAAATTTFNDTRFQWQTVSAGNLTLSYYRGSRADAMNLLTVGRTAIDKASQLESAQIDFPVRVYVYASSQDFLPAAQKESKATDPGILGQALTPDAVILWVADTLRSADTEDTVRHELTHLVTGQAVKGGFSNLLPLWLNEGTSVYSQNDPGDYGRSLRQAIASDTVVPIQVLESSRGVDVGLFYGESYGLVKFLVDTNGPGQFAQLLAAIGSGKSLDQALQSVYGFDRTGLYNAWRDSVHLSGPGVSGANRAQGGSAATPGSGENPGTSTSAGSGSTPSRGNTPGQVIDRGTTVLLATLAAALGLLLLAAIVGLGLMLSRRARN